MAPENGSSAYLHRPLVPKPGSDSPFTTVSDVGPINTSRDFLRMEFLVECKKLWLLAGPAIFNTLCQYSLGAITQTFAGHLGDLELAAFSIENSVIDGFSFGIMLGMGSALETLCGQAYGAGQLDMLGVYMQRSWVILDTTGLILSLLYIFAKPLLRLIGQKEEIADMAGMFSIWMLPQLFAYAMNFPIAKFLQSQSKMMVMAAISAVALGLHTLLSWVLMFKLKWGLVGAAVMLNASWWFIVVAQLVYIFSGTCGRAWSGFTWRAFHNLWGFVKLSIASAVMLCLEVWYLMALILIAGYLKNPEISVDALSICMNISGWTLMVALGYNAATSIRVSNELGAGNPRSAKFAIVVVVINSFIVGLILALILVTFRKEYPTAFTNSEVVRKLVANLTPLLAFSIVINSVQPILTGISKIRMKILPQIRGTRSFSKLMLIQAIKTHSHFLMKSGAAVGAGRQALVAYVNIGCYYIFGVPLGLLLGCVFNYGVQASVAEDRIRTWGGEPDAKETMNE
ncbi:hypothetical protein Syun_024203 [Stephania yunnanensis]|uniref:Protein DETOXIFICATION n=1 Tax=Stephania yunnanensis TaxID=152371 RepID=A0AAP0I2S7_9MAGN